MSRYERWNALLELLAEDGRLEVEKTAERLQVSAATIRRDLDQLAKQQMVTRTRGGAVAHNVSYDLPLRYKTAKHATEKQHIAAAAAEWVRPGSVVGLNGGTTTTEVARVLALRSDPPRGERQASYTVVTNALNIANELTVRPQVKIVVTGGVARPQSFELTGPLAGGVLDQVTLDIAVIGVDGVDAASGASAHHEGEAATNRQLADRAEQVVIVADSSKVGQRAFARICGPERVNVLVTDSGVDDDAVRTFTEAGVRVVVT